MTIPLIPSLRSGFLAVALVFGTTALPQLSAVQAQDSARVSLDWPGNYSGTLPCASCPGIKTQLTLKSNETYQLTETYMGKSKPITSKGRFVWDKGGSIIRLTGAGENRLIFISEGFVEILGESKKPGNSQYQLAKAGYAAAEPQQQTVFRYKRESLRLAPKTIVVSDVNTEQHVRADAIWDFGRIMPQTGHRSMAVTLDINCKKREFALPAVAYYAKANGKGRLIDKVAQPDVDANPIGKSDDVILQVAETYCTR